MAESKKVSNNFSAFLIVFFVLTTIIVFAVMLFLSYENMAGKTKRTLHDSAEDLCECLVQDITAVSDGASFEFTVNDDGSEDFRISSEINKFVNSKLYENSGSIYITDIEGNVYSQNKTSGFANEKIYAVSQHGSLYVIKDVVGGEVLKGSEKNLGNKYTLDKTDEKDYYFYSISGRKIPGTEYYVLVKESASILSVFNEFVDVVLFPAVLSMLIAISLYIAFVAISFRPVKDISAVIARVSDGDYTARVQQKYVDANDIGNLSLSSEFTEMAITLNTMIESIQNQEKDRELFISSIAHDIRTPLTSINGFVTAMLDGTIPPENYDKYMNLIKQETNRIRKLVVSMTEASSLAHVNPELMEEFNTTDMIIDIIENLESQLAEKNITILKSLDPGPDNIAYGDSQQLCRVIINIITNAIKFTPQDGVIKVTTEGVKRDNMIVITVEDSGPGIPENKRKRIFDSFYQADASRKQEGFGLGLYICKQILFAHGQTIVCDESHELGGAKFIFSFAFPPKDNE